MSLLQLEDLGCANLPPAIFHLLRQQALQLIVLQRERKVHLETICSLRANLVVSEGAQSDLHRQADALRQKIVDLEQQAQRVNSIPASSGPTAALHPVAAPPSARAATAQGVTAVGGQGGFCPGSRAALQRLANDGSSVCCAKVDPLLSDEGNSDASGYSTSTLDLLCTAAHFGHMGGTDPEDAAQASALQRPCSLPSTLSTVSTHGAVSAEASQGRHKRSLQESEGSDLGQAINPAAAAAGAGGASVEPAGSLAIERLGAAGSLARIRQQAAARG